MHGVVSPEHPRAALPLPHRPARRPEVRRRRELRLHQPPGRQAGHRAEAGGLPLHRHLQRQEDQTRHGDDRGQEDATAGHQH